VKPFYLLSELAEHVGGRLQGSADPQIRGVSSLEEPVAGTISFIEQASQATRVGPAALIVPSGVTPDLPSIVVVKPRLAFATLLRLFYPTQAIVAGIHPTACIHPTAVIDPSARVGPYCVVGSHCRLGIGVELVARVSLGAHVEIETGAHLEAGVHVGEHGRVGAHSWVEPRVTVGEGASVGSHVYLGARTSLATQAVVETGCKVDNMTVVSQGARVGPHCILVSGCMIGERAELSAYCVVAAQTVVSPGVKLAVAVQIAGRSIVEHDVTEKGQQMAGEPVLPLREEIRARTQRARAHDYYLRLQKLRKP
jgi:UDP-3-O-[3-hydroxymyristoyl] glucosamine N-acyltransferase